MSNLSFPLAMVGYYRTGQTLWTPGADLAWTAVGAPTTPVCYYDMELIGKTCKAEIAIIGASAGTSITAMSLVLPSVFPTPLWWPSHSTNDFNKTPINGAFCTSDTAQPQAIATYMLRVNELTLLVASGNYKNVFANFTYTFA